MTPRRPIQALLVAAAITLAPAYALAQSILDTPKAPASRSARPTTKRTKSGPRASSRAPSSKARKPADVATQNVVLPPFDVDLDEDSVCAVLTRLGLVTLFEFEEEIDFIWFSDSDRWRLVHDGNQIGVSPGFGEADKIRETKWSEVRETLYVRVADGFTYKFALTVTAGAPNSFLRVHRKEPEPPPGPTPEEIARREAEAEERLRAEATVRAEEATRLKRESAFAAARAVPLSEKPKKLGDLEVRVARPVTIDGTTYVAFELFNRGKAPASPTLSVVPGRPKAERLPDVEIVVDSAVLQPRARRSGVVVVQATSGPARPIALHLEIQGRKPLDVPLSE